MHARPKAALLLQQLLMPTESSGHAKCSIYFSGTYNAYNYLQVKTGSGFMN
jgi:hypothetical protein